MRWLRSLRNRIFLASSLLAVLPVAGAFVLVSHRVTRQAEGELTREVTEAARRLDEYHGSRTSTLTEMAQLVADLPMLKAAVATGDPPTVARFAEDAVRRLRCDLLVLTDAEGRTLATVGATDEAWIATSPFSPRPVVVVRGRHVLEVIAAPIVVGPAPAERLGTLTIGYRIDDALAARLGRVIGSDVAFADGRVVRGSTLGHEHDSEILRLPEGRPTRVLEGSYLALKLPMLGSESDAPRIVILRSRAEGLRFLRTLRWALAIAALVALGVAVVLSYAVARSVTRPLATLTSEMSVIAATGDLTRQIPPGGRWDDEDAQMLARTFNALTASIARFQRESALKDRLSALGRLSTVVAHEVRNPLMIIKAALRSIRRTDISADERREAADDIDHEVARLDRIVGDVLDYARPPRLELVAVDLPVLCREVSRDLESGNSGISCLLSIAPDVGRIATDPDRLRTVLTNVVENARDSVRAISANGGDDTPREVRVAVRRLAGAREEVEIAVSDTGHGIPPEDLPHLFEPYFTTRRAGTGLGLPIAKNVVEALGGSIQASNLAEGGAVVRIVLPTQGPPEGRKETS